MREANFDGLVGPTHHYAGLSFGNVASTKNAKLVSHPKKAALQGLKKAAHLRDLGLLQGILPPLRRPRLEPLRAQGFSGTDSEIITCAHHSAPELLSACYSASSMWVANAATFSPSVDSHDGRAHFTVANLVSKLHRSFEPEQTRANLRHIFPGDLFVHHAPINPQFGDEGAANHSRLSPSHDTPGIEVFTFGASVLREGEFRKPKKFPSRQALEASEAVCAAHSLESSRALFFQQNPDAIDAGVFHNDVVSVANENVLLLHEKTYFEQEKVLEKIRKEWNALGTNTPLHVIEIAEREVSLEDAIGSYLFNSQLVTLPSGKMVMICPEECRETRSVKAVLDRLGADLECPIGEVHYLDVRESMQNGGGPACLRLRVCLTEKEEAAVHPGVWLTREKETQLEEWISKHYRDQLALDDLGDPKLYSEVDAAMDALEKILGFPLA
jgi:succinylarginine dihydrolase